MKRALTTVALISLGTGLMGQSGCDGGGVPLSFDAGPYMTDAGPGDAGHDAGRDAGRDSGTDAGPPRVFIREVTLCATIVRNSSGGGTTSVSPGVVYDNWSSSFSSVPMSVNEMRNIHAEILSSGEMTVFTIPPTSSLSSEITDAERRVRVDGTLPCYGPFPIPYGSTVERTSGATVRTLTMTVQGITVSGSSSLRTATIPGEVTAADFAFRQADGTYRGSPISEAYVHAGNIIDARATVYVRFNISAPPTGRPDPAIFLSALERLRHAPSRRRGRSGDTATARARTGHRSRVAPAVEYHDTDAPEAEGADEEHAK